MAYIDTVGDVARVTFAWLLSTEQLQECNVHYKVLVAGGGDSRAALQILLDTATDGNLTPFVNTLTTYFGSKLSMVKATVKPGPVVSHVNIAGTGGAATLVPSQCRALVTWRADVSDHGNHGRVYLPTPDLGYLTALGRLNAGGTAITKAWANAIGVNQVVGGTTWVPQIVKYTHKPTVVVRAVDIVANEVHNQLATQRRSGDFGRTNFDPW